MTGILGCIYLIALVASLIKLLIWIFIITRHDFRFNETARHLKYMIASCIFAGISYVFVITGIIGDLLMLIAIFLDGTELFMGYKVMSPEPSKRPSKK